MPVLAMTPIDPQKLGEAIERIQDDIASIRAISGANLDDGPLWCLDILTVLAALTEAQEQLAEYAWRLEQDYGIVALLEKDGNQLKQQLSEAKEQLKNTEIQVGLEMSAVRQLKAQLDLANDALVSARQASKGRDV